MPVLSWGAIQTFVCRIAGLVLSRSTNTQRWDMERNGKRREKAVLEIGGRLKHTCAYRQGIAKGKKNKEREGRGEARGATKSHIVTYHAEQIVEPVDAV